MAIVLPINFFMSPLRIHQSFFPAKVELCGGLKIEIFDIPLTIIYIFKLLLNFTSLVKINSLLYDRAKST